MSDDSGRIYRAVVAGGFFAALLIRLLFLHAFVGNQDVGDYRSFVSIVDHGGDLFRETNRYHFSPVWAHVLWCVAGVGEIVGVSFAHAVGGLFLAADAVTAWLLFLLAGGGRHGREAALLFFLNPVSVFVSSFHLQWDGLAIMFLLLALLAAKRLPARRASVAAALSASLLVKHITAFFPPLFAAGGRRGMGRWWTLAPYAIFAVTLLPYWRSWPAIRERVLGYRSLNEDFGVAMLLTLKGVPNWVPDVIFFLAIGAAILAVRNLDRERACLMLWLVMLLFAPGMCEYYLVWPIAIGSLFGGAGYFVYTAVVSSFYFGSPDGLGMPLRHLPGWHGIWWSLLFWLTWDVRLLQRRRTTGVSSLP